MKRSETEYRSKINSNSIMEYSSYSSSIQKTSVFINPSLEISNGGISYFNTFLIDLTNCIVIESINRSKQSVAQSKYLSVDAVQDSINQIFSYELSDVLTEIRHKAVQINNITNRLLEGHSIDSLPNLSSSLTTSTISSSEINKPVTQSPQSHHHQLDAVTLIGSNQPEEIKPNTKIIESPIIEPITNTNTTPTETTTTTQSPNINTAITPKVESPKQTTSPIISSPTTPTPVNIQDNTTATQTTSTITNTTTTTTKPNTQPTKETNQVTKRDVKSPTTTATTKTITSPIQTHVNLTAITIPSLIFVNKPFDLVQALKNDHILLEKSNGILLVFLILVGLLIQTV
ncbi:hypothetical protein PPL_02163 [Heterostelium album PN500]|uniref:Uncharacterized protein n=1 Tax=Heterostelium pallidum (strain ATCC 26659 / Pp 5 / PN500) TaxID=670386 RepID=D3B1I9_HETP5|nr:hypothetical protein PPL_02163 [Heterostelium album PN500]EFA85163.1 hypothetical protein PPL_02163 [Heterostelium album PN500]|eukprot:XP_020437272.1 hypothetical protein PPL_02163 [Heterostelium album PN500]